MNQLTMQTQASDAANSPPADDACVSLDPDLVSTWISYLDAQMEVRHDGRISELRDRLADEYWLARWQRGQIQLEFCPAFGLEIVEALREMTDQKLDEPLGNTANTLRTLLSDPALVC